jgi:hypothetical protein
MASIFCPDCGAKALYTLNKPKFCQTCGAKFRAVSNATITTGEEETVEEVPTIDKLDYSIEIDSSTTTLGDLFKNPLNPDELDVTSGSKGRPKKHKKQTKEKFLAQSMAECASSRQQPAITEDGAE